MREGDISHYHVLEKLGEGAMGEVYRAEDTRLKRTVALKFLAPGMVADASRRQRFLHEAQAAAALDHSSICTVYEIDERDGEIFLAMAFIDGPTLQKKIEQRPLKLEEAVEIAIQTGEGLEAAHNRGIVHRDIKSSNILLTSRGQAKITDFGLAMLGDRTGLTQAGALVGTPGYMSPEQARGETADARSDIWSLGVVLYEMVSGQLPFGGNTASAAIFAILHREPESLTALRSGVPVEMDRIVAKALAKIPAERYQHAADILVDLRSVKKLLEARPRTGSAEPEAAASPAAAGTEARAGAQPARKRRRAAALILGGLIAGAGLALLLRPAGEPGAASRRYVPFATEAAAETMPCWSPDGKTIAYLAEVDGINQVFTKGLTTPVPVQVTRSASECGSPFWSADGTQILYTAREDLWSVSVAGGEPQLRVKDALIPSMSSDGRVLAFVRGSADGQSLWVAQAPDLTPRQYRQTPFPEKIVDISALAVSHDGSKLAMFVDLAAGGAGELWVIPYPSGRPRSVSGSWRGGGRVLAWTPGNRHVVMDGGLNAENRHLVLVDADSGATSAVSEGTSEERYPSVSPDGRKIAFTAGGVDYDLVEIGVGGAPVSPLLATSRGESYATWAPSGSQFCYTTDAGGSAEIWVRNTTEGWGKPVVTRETEGMPDWHALSTPRISPDGRRIAYDALGIQHGIWISAITGGRAAPLDPQSSDSHAPSWSPDGNWIAYRRLHQGKWELAKAPVGGGSPVSLEESSDRAAGSGGLTDWSPAGEWICHRGLDGLRLISPDGSRHKLLSKSRRLWFGFSRDGATVYAIRRSATRQWELAVMDVASASERQVRALAIPQDARVEGFSVHPNGKSILTAIGTARQDIWILEGFRLPGGWWSRLWKR